MELDASYRRIARVRLASRRNLSRGHALCRSANDSFARQQPWLAVSGGVFSRRSLFPKDILEPFAHLPEKYSYSRSRRFLQQLGHTRTQIFPR